MDNWLWLFADIPELLADFSTDTASMAIPTTPPGGSGGNVWCPPSYSVEELIRLHAPSIDAQQFAIMPSGE